MPHRRVALRREPSVVSKLHLYPMTGGIALPSAQLPVTALPLPPPSVPSILHLPLRQHVGWPSRPIVKVGQRVAKYECLAEAGGYVSSALHAPVSGHISAIGEHSVVHPGGLPGECISLIPDLDERVVPLAKPEGDSAEAMLRALGVAGIVGLGGAGFPAHVKIREAAMNKVALLIINGVECEPHSFSDDYLLRERATDVVRGAAIVCQLVRPARAVIAVEDDMPDALAALESVVPASIETISVPTRYPAGSEKQLIEILLNRQVPSNGLPINVEALVLNVATVAAVARAIDFGEPLTERNVTLCGSSTEVRRALIGTPVGEMLDATFGATNTVRNVVSGGSMMGVAVRDADSPIVKTTATLSVGPVSDTTVATDCIRCGDCVTVCPVGLQAQKLFDLSRIGDLDGVQDYHLFDCIECGCCAFVCPSKIPLVHYYRYAKSAVDSLEFEHSRAQQAGRRFARRQQRAADRGAMSGEIDLVEVAELTSDVIADELDAALARAAARDASTNERDEH